MSLELCSLAAKNPYRSAEFPRSTYVRLLPKGRKNSAEKEKGNLSLELCSLATKNP